jgi:hypothetical protein
MLKRGGQTPGSFKALVDGANSRGGTISRSLVESGDISGLADAVEPERGVELWRRQNIHRLETPDTAKSE